MLRNSTFASKQFFFANHDSGSTGDGSLVTDEKYESLEVLVHRDFHFLKVEPTVNELEQFTFGSFYSIFPVVISTEVVELYS